MNFYQALILPLILGLSATLVSADDTSSAPVSKDSRKKIVLIAGPKSHGPVGNGIHDYPWSVKLLKVMLDNSNIKDQIRVEYHLDGWPENPETLNDADTIMVISDGRDGEKFTEAPHFASQDHLNQIQRQIDRGCGFLTFHFSTFAPDQYAKQILDWSGGFFDWEENGVRNWYSAIKTIEAPVQIPHPDHPICRGVKPFEMREEFYFNLRFQQNDPHLVPLLEVPELKGRAEQGNVVAWAKERANGGRGFGTTCGHFYDNWQNAAFRKFILNAIAWTAQTEIPATGVQARYYTHAEITSALSGVKGTAPATFDDQPIRVLMFAGNEAHAWHNWKKTTPVIKKLLEQDPRIKVEISNDIEDLSRKSLQDYQVIVQNYTNWHDKTPLSPASQTAFMNYLQQGGGLILIHFANGAFHFSLPKAGASDWPEYRKIVRRVWNHYGKGEQKSGHDAFGNFEVQITDDTQPLTRNLQNFPVTDELYFRQDGTEPVEPLITAKSKVTKKNEPLAWTYHYGKGRIFQTLLGHSEKTYDSFEACEMLRRATAWAANRPIHEFKRPPQAPVEKKSAALLPLGKWGKALNTNAGSIVLPSETLKNQKPISADCWVKLNSKSGFNVFLASSKKSNPAHWEMYSYARSGFFSVYLPGQGGEYKTRVNICDQKWHYVGMILEDSRIRLFVDGKKELDSPLPPPKQANVSSGNLRIGGLVEKTLASDGLLDELRISKGTRDLTQVPQAPLKADAETLILFSLDELTKDLGTKESVSNKLIPLETRTQVSRSTPVKKKETRDHWGKESVGFDQPVQATEDNRWQQTEIGNWLASIVPLPTGPVKKGLSIRVGDQREGTICYDTQNCKVRGIWSGGFLKPSPARFGLIQAPAPQGTMHFSTQEGPGWNPDQPCRFLGSHVNRNRVTLEYLVGETTIYESPWLQNSSGQTCFTRSFEIGPGSQSLQLYVADGRQVKPVSDSNHQFISTGPQNAFIIGCTGWDQIQSKMISAGKSQSAVFEIPPRKATQRFTIFYQTNTSGNPRLDIATPTLTPPSLQPLLIPGATHWNEPLITQGVLSQAEDAYVIDTITIPFDNPYRALFFVSGHDFLENGDLAVATVHGDVWLVKGVDHDLKQLKWKRFATGLFQPLGLKVVQNKIHVLGRDQITILHDQNLDDEADFYECFHNQYPTSPGGHDYVTCLETDSFGNFYFLHAQRGVMQVTSNGRQLNVVASGFRNPNGMGIGPRNIITASPQEGNWTPASNVTEVKQGGYYGYGGPRITADRPLGYDRPLCWIPRLQDNSSGGQVWVTSQQWGPLQGQLLHLSYGQSKLLLTLREVIQGQSQGGTLTLPLNFDSGIMRGRFNPRDGQLYVSGMKGWVTNAVRDGCLQRVRYTGQPVDLPTAVKTMQNGIALTFTNPLERNAAENPDNYAIEQWNYLWSQNYGSPEYRVSAPQVEGRDEVEVLSATLLPDQRTVFLELPSVKPVMQMGISYHLSSVTGRNLKQTYYHTINAVSSQKMDSEQLTRRKKSRLLTLTQRQQLKPGILWKFKQQHPQSTVDSDARSARMLALSVDADRPATPFLKPGPFSATAEGFLRVPLSGEYYFSLEGIGECRLTINQKTILQSEKTDFKKLAPAAIKLEKGYNQLRLDYQSPLEGPARLRLLWKGAQFATEPVPPTILTHMGNDPLILKMQQVRAGRELFASYRCLSCHTVESERSGVRLFVSENHPFSHDAAIMPELNQSPPELVNIGNRVSKRWLFHWLRNPHSLKPEARMPHLLGDPDSKQAVQQAADLTAWFVSQATQPMRPSSSAAFNFETIDPEQLIQTGAQHYEELGCINCHHFETDPTQADDYQRRSLALIKRKFSFSQLARFLQTPHAHHRWSRMPDFQLTSTEAAGLAAYLIDSSQGKIPNAMIPPAGSAARGRQLYFETLGCARCHGPLQENRKLQTVKRTPLPLRNLSTGCLADSHKADSRTPHFQLSAFEKEAIRSFLKFGTDSLAQQNNSEISTRWMRALNCAACHHRDADSSPRGIIVVEEGASGLPPAPLPSLTWAGEKLKPDWLLSFIAGELKWRPRPWLKSRMPHFPAHAQLLASGLRAEHGLPPQTPPDSSIAQNSKTSTQRQLGRQLINKQALDCRQCHGIGDQYPSGDDKTRIAPGINFVHIRERLTPEYYHRFVLDPPRFDISTKMPKLSADGQTTKISTILNGDADRQFQAIWQYIQSLQEPPRRFRLKPDSNDKKSD
ncbi:ThuA domain-containing protein [Gimesia panareensis]|uniref:ThuA domain-containing protein n=1 Tax=Gimesia panareensis TaxID=2527978 RepID=UPI00118845A3|nr:ThuA domain-containing protein [Gimesia panareensis]QDU49926.1 Trehalose utilization [Gimesia panareensis]